MPEDVKTDANSPAAFRPEARAPRGLQDRRGRDVALERALLTRVTAVYERYGFEPLDTSAFEYADALGKFLPDADRPNEGVFALQDDDEQWMALRYDLTAPLARFAAQNWETLPKPFRRYAYGPVWRNEKPGPGRFREFTQCDADIVGSARPEADAEIIALAVEGLEAAGLKGPDSGPGEQFGRPDREFIVQHSNYIIKINNRKLLDGILASADVHDTQQKLSVMRAIDKYDRLGLFGVEQLLKEGREDESGAYTKGAGLTLEAANAVLSFVATAIILDRSTFLMETEKIVSQLGGSEGFEELAKIHDALASMGIRSEQARFDFSVVRGLEYYTGAVFEAELLLQTVDEKGRAMRFGSIGGGGRYDDLVARFTGERTPATGFSFGVSRLLSALKAAGRDEANKPRGPVVIIAFNPEHMADYFAIARELRNAKDAKGNPAPIPAEVYLGASGMKAQMKYADRRMAPAVVMFGEDEMAAGTVTVKDLDLGRELSANVSDSAEWRAARPGQATIPRAELIPFIRRILGEG